MIDFSAMQLGEEIELPAGEWRELRPIHEACTEYMHSATPRPQFEFDALKGANARNSRDQQRWVIRRIR